MATQL